MRLNLGCGKKRIDGFIGLDKSKKSFAEIICDLEVGLPIKDNCIEEVKAIHILEHIKNFIELMEDIHRVCRKGAIVDIEVPYYKSGLAFSVSTHVRFFSESSFDIFLVNPIFKPNVPYSNVKFRLLEYIKKSSPSKRLIPFKGFFSKFLWDIYSIIEYKLEVIK